MREQFPPVATNERERSNETLHIFETSERVKHMVAEELSLRHSKKIYHTPDHTLPQEGKEDLTSVVGGVRTLTRFLKESFRSSLTDATIAPIAEGMEAGAAAHDVIIELKGITEVEGLGAAGMIQRKRGWMPGGNEWESYRFLRREFLTQYAGSEESLTPEEEEMMHELLTDPQSPDYDEAYTRYMTAAERVVGGTDPDAMNFSAPLPASVVEQYPESVRTLVKGLQWSQENPTYAGFMIDSSKTTASLEGLLGSTADLGAVSDPEVFVRTGNAEFWELEYGIARDCARFLEDEQALSGARMRNIVRAMSA